MVVAVTSSVVDVTSLVVDVRSVVMNAVVGVGLCIALVNFVVGVLGVCCVVVVCISCGAR